MNSLIGRNGFIGSALAKRFKRYYNYLRPDVNFVYWFAAPSSQILFNHAPEYCTNQTIDSFTNIFKFCSDNNIKLIYPLTASTGNDYADCKYILESVQKGSSYKKVLGLKISAGYGPGEKHKGIYASVIYQFCKQMKNGARPIIYGDGTQTRDFIYIDDLVDAILVNKHRTGVIEIGTGVNTSFNEVVKIINDELGTNIEPFYIEKPNSYLEETRKITPVPFRYSVREGVKKILESLD